MRRAVPTTITIALAVLAGCSGGTGGTGDDADAVTAENCGIEVSVSEPPQRIYALYRPAAEIAHALGISDRLVETSFHGSQVLPDYVQAQEQVPLLSNLPSREALLATEPDFVLSGFGTGFSADGPDSIGTRASLAELGIPSWVISPFCPTEDGKTDQEVDPADVRVEAVWEDLRDLGRLFDVEAAAAEQVIADQTSRITAVEQAVAGADRPTVAIVGPQDDGTFQISGGIDFVTELIERAGGVNAFADVTDTRNIWVDAEELIECDPDVILTTTCCDAAFTRQDGQSDVAEILGHPALAGLTAVENQAVHPFLFEDRGAEVRMAQAVEIIASVLHPDLVQAPA